MSETASIDPMARTAILFTTHVINAQVEAHFFKLRDELPKGYELFLFHDEQRIPERKARKLAGGAILSHDKDGWKRFKRPGRYFKEKIPGNADGLLMNAMDRLPGYDWYWYIEYDVAFSGDWRTFFAAMEESDADMLATCVMRGNSLPDWPLWKSIEVPEGEALPENERLRVLLVISRFSRRVNEVLAPVYQQGWAGHFEALFASLAARHGLRIEDIGGKGEFVRPGNTDRFYRNTPTSNSLGPGTLVFRPAMEKPGDEPDMLWHPVKKTSRHDWDNAGSPFRNLFGRVMRKLKRTFRPGG